MPATTNKLLTPEVKALVGQSTAVSEMYDVIDKESIRRFVVGIPDQEPMHWDEELAKPRFGGVITPPLMVRYVAHRKPPYEEDRMNEIMLADEFNDSGGGMKRAEESLP